MIEDLARRTKDGDREATSKLLKLFNPLIYKISEQIYVRYGRIFPLDEIARQSKCALVYLTITEYQLGGKAHYPYFIKKKLHAHLVQLYRPIYILSVKSVPLDQISLIIQPPNFDEEYEEGIREAYDKHIHEIYEKTMQYINENFNEREQDLIYSCLCDKIPRNQLAKKYHVSFIRMKVIYNKVIKKLKKYLSKLGITSIDEI